MSAERTVAEIKDIIANYDQMAINPSVPTELEIKALEDAIDIAYVGEYGFVDGRANAARDALRKIKALRSPL